MYCQALGSQIKMCFTAVSTKWAFFFFFSTRLLPTGRRVLFWSWNRTLCLQQRSLSHGPSACLLSSLCLTNSSAATSVWWSTLLRWMNLIRLTPAFHFAAESARRLFRCSAVTLAGLTGSLPGGHLQLGGRMEVQSPGAKKRFVTLTKLLQHDSVTLSVCCTGCNVPGRMYSHKSRRKNKRGEWREQRSGGQQPRCFPNNTRLKFTDMMKGRRWRRCRGGLPVSRSDLGQKHNPASVL